MSLTTACVRRRAAGLAIFYVGNEDPGEWRTRLYWDCFRASQADGAFRDQFSRVVAANFKACEASWTHRT